MATSWERAAHSVNHMFSLYYFFFVILVIYDFGFENRDQLFEINDVVS